MFLLGLHADEGVAEARDSVGEARSGVHGDARLSGYAAPGVGHVDGGRFVPGVDQIMQIKDLLFGIPVGTKIKFPDESGDNVAANSIDITLSII